MISVLLCLLFAICMWVVFMNHVYDFHNNWCTVNKYFVYKSEITSVCIYFHTDALYNMIHLIVFKCDKSIFY